MAPTKPKPKAKPSSKPQSIITKRKEAVRTHYALRARLGLQSEPHSEPMEPDPNAPNSPILKSPRSPKSPKFVKSIPLGKGYKEYKEQLLEEGRAFIKDSDFPSLEFRLTGGFPIVSNLITPKDWPKDVYPISTVGFYSKGPGDKHNIRIIKSLGNEGSQGTVLLAEIKHAHMYTTRATSNSETKRNLHVIKVIKIPPTTVEHMPPNELRVLSNLGAYHPSITTLKAFATEAGLDILYFPYADAGDLATFIEMSRSKNLIIPEAFIWHILTHLIEAVYFLQFPEPCNDAYEYTIWHLDIKPGNVFMQWPLTSKDNSDYYPNIQLGGFDLAIEVRKTLLRKSGAAAPGPLGLKLPGFTGTIPYAAPEQLRGYYSDKTDVWGIGATIHECVHGYPPITPQRTHYTRARSTGTHTIYKRALYSELEWRGMPGTPRACWEMPGHYSATLRETLYHLLREDASPKTHADDQTKRLEIEDLKCFQAKWGRQMKTDYFVGLPGWF